MKKISVLMFLFFFPAFSIAAENADSLISEGKAFYQQGNFEQAALAWQKAGNLLDKEKDAGKYLETITNLASAYQNLGYHKRALTVFRDALPIIRKSQDRNRNIMFLNRLGDLHLSLGENDEADKYLSESSEQARQANNPEILANVLNNVGNALAADEDYEGALAAYEEGVEQSATCNMQRAKCDELKAGLLLNIARVIFLERDDKNIVSAYDAAALQIEKLPASSEKSAYLISLGLLARKIHKDMPNTQIIGKAVEALNASADIARNVGDMRMLSSAYGYLGQLYEDEKQYAEAMNLTRKAVFFGQQGKYPQILYLWQWQIGRLFKDMENLEEAVKSYKNAVETLNPIRQELFKGFRGKRQDAFNESVKPVYFGLADLLLRQAEKITDPAAVQNKLIEVQDVLESLKASELQDFFADECVIALQKKLTSSDHRTPPKTAVLYPIAMADRLVLLVYLPDGIKQFTVPVSSDTLKKQALLYRQRLQTRPNNRFLHESWQLYDWLIRPVEKELDAIQADTLVVAPDGPLRLFPFSTLNDGKQFLIEKYAIATIPAITLTDSKPAETDYTRILLSGLSDGVQDFSPLPSVTAELRDIKEIMGGKVLIQNKEYTIDNLTAVFKKDPYTSVHLATHGVFGGSPEESFLLTYNSKLTMNKLEALIKQSRNQVELLTLSACQTALGNERAELGLAGAAIKAGVRSVIATLWFVDDEATSLAIREVYRQLRIPGMSKAKALQNAQKKLIAQLRYRHPLYWGPFLLIGNWY
jgi:CHAT domain-containing protein/predicted negative regulator of RcsB-dependent stress response